jgi:hypothetical protein
MKSFTFHHTINSLITLASAAPTAVEQRATEKEKVFLCVDQDYKSCVESTSASQQYGKYSISSTSTYL